MSGSIAGNDQEEVKLRHLPRSSPGPKNSSAAERLHMAQPPLSVAIDQLEQEARHQPPPAPKGSAARDSVLLAPLAP
ncbi:MAG TPA: LysR family transcriptional regulator, partial [Solirubrobacterales bacterium]|nr:LysR family transcriptional regulator [Solirubrobacterales bacterium]